VANTTVRWPRVALAVGAVAGVVTWAWLLVELVQRRVTVVVGFEATRNPLYRLWRHALPDYRRLDPADWVLHGLWIAMTALLVLLGWRSAASPSHPVIPEEGNDVHDLATPDRWLDAGTPVGSLGVR
jgi:hypothetical protein